MNGVVDMARVRTLRPNEVSAAGQTLAERLEYLIATVYPRGAQPYTNEEIAALVAEEGLGTLSVTQIKKLRYGVAENPTLTTLQQLAGVFGVSISFFDCRDHEVARETVRAVEWAKVRRDAPVRQVVARMDDMDEDTRELTAELVDKLAVVNAKHARGNRSKGGRAKDGGGSGRRSR
ncbi:hypothetical protein [Sciscionella sediminilitoris]|uniref:hypothetical protein n=1 Tax=Sciscionella sediminilitoris TaxID=1445613 RepID=UPI000689229B|nr:hypothetical protein [Sciscionella sp. SE31]